MPNDILESLPNTLRTETHGTLTEYFDVRAKSLESSIKAFLTFNGDYRSLTLNQVESLAPFFGFNSETFWAKSWSIQTKSMLLSGVYQEPFIWQNNGQRKVLDFVLKCFNIQGQLVKDEGFIVDVDIVDVKILSVGNSYNLEVKNLTYSVQKLCEKILSVYFPVGIQVKIISV